VGGKSSRAGAGSDGCISQEGRAYKKKSRQLGGDGHHLLKRKTEKQLLFRMEGDKWRSRWVKRDSNRAFGSREKERRVLNSKRRPRDPRFGPEEATKKGLVPSQGRVGTSGK